MLRRHAATPKKYEHIDFTPPEGAANAAAKGLEYREKASPSNKGGLTPAEASKEGIGSGVQRAVNLKNRNTLSPDTIKQMHGFFSRHEKNKGVAPEHKSEPWNDKGHVAWLLWGGDAARSWVDKVLGQMEKADEREAVKKAARFLASGPSLSLDDLGYGSLTTDEEALLLTPSAAFPANVLAFIPQVPCPENSSLETRRELAHLLRLQHEARPYLAQQVAATDENATATLEAYCAEHGLDASGVLPITNAARPVILQVKRLYNRPRPYQLAEFLEPGFRPMSSTTAHTPSYPSGHSAQAVLVALLLSGLYPEHRDAFMALAQEVGTHRMVGGYHFLSDITYGEQVGRVLYESMARASVRTAAAKYAAAKYAAAKYAAAKYKEKKKVPKADGSGKTTVYVYSERQVANRHREKAERLEDFKPALAELRAQVKKDLDANDPKKNLVALAVGLIDATYERVGNEDSADNGHYGVTGWLRKHVTFKGKRAVIRYVGKSGVKHEKSVDDEALVGALKKCCGDKDGDEAVLSLGKHTVTSDEVNKYLKPYGITAKDLRGLHANREMQERLRAIRSKGPKLPRLRKERDPILKEEFQKALEGAAEAVGHEPATLRKQYLVPGIEEAYMKDGTVTRDLTASTRVAALYLRATKTDAEREDEEAERLLKPEPKYKPPRNDLRRRRVETEQDADPDKKQDDKDRSQNYKDAAHRALVQRVAARFLFAKSGPGGSATNTLQERAQKEFDAYEKEHPDTELKVEDFVERIQKQQQGSSGGAPLNEKAQAAQQKAELAALEVKRKSEGVQKAVDKVSAMWKDMPNLPGMSKQNHERIKEAVSSFGPKQREEFLAAFETEKDALVGKYAGDKSEYDPAFVEEALQSMENTPKGKDPKAVGKKAMQAIFTDRVLLNPLMLTPSDPLSDNPDKGDERHPPAKAAKRVGQAVKRFSRASKAEVDAMSGRLKSALKACEPGSPQHEELLAMQYGMAVAAAMPKAKPKGRHGDEPEGEGGKPEKAAKPPEGMSGVEFGLLQHLHKKGDDTSELVGLSFRNSRDDKSAVADTKKFVREQADGMSMGELNDMLPPNMQSLSASFLALKKSLPFVSEGLFSGFSEKSRSKQRAEQEAGWSKDEARIADELRTTLVDCVSETVGKDEKAVTRASRSVKDYAHDTATPKGDASKSGKSWADWLQGLRADFMKALGSSSKTGSRRVWSPTVPGYALDAPPLSVAALYTL